MPRRNANELFRALIDFNDSDFRQELHPFEHLQSNLIQPNAKLICEVLPCSVVSEYNMSVRQSPRVELQALDHPRSRLPQGC